MTDVAVSPDASSVLIATLPNPDQPGAGGTKPRLVRLGPKGKPVWTRELGSSVRFLAMGDRAYASTYDETVLSFPLAARAAGWKRSAQCRPMLLGPGRVICYHDDDAEPRIAFEAWSDRGAKLGEFPVGADVTDILDLEVSSDQKWIAIALTGGRVLLVTADDHGAFKTVWSARVEGEVIDVSVASSSGAGLAPRMAVLSSVPQLQQRLSLYSGAGDRLAVTSPAWHGDQIEISADGAGTALYGNGSLANGQYLAWFEMQGAQLKELWSHGDRHAAEYQSSVSLTADGIIVGYEKVEQGVAGRSCHVLHYDFQGRLRWDLLLPTDEGAYLYAQVYAPETRTLVVGTDDGWVRAFR
jgi:hypothetical protein